MAKRYVKAYYDWIEQTSALSDAEKGRLFIAILEYARSGLIPEDGGRESLVFPIFKAIIDREAEISAIRSENGAKGGKPAEASESKAKQNEASESKAKQNEASESKAKPTKDIRHKTEDIRHKTEDNKGITPIPPCDGFDVFWKVYPRHTAKETAVKAWKKLNPPKELQEKIVTAVKDYAASPQWKKDNGQYIPHPATFLNQRRWEDEVPCASSWDNPVYEKLCLPKKLF